MVTESPDRIGVARSWSSTASGKDARSICISLCCRLAIYSSLQRFFLFHCYSSTILFKCKAFLCIFSTAVFVFLAGAAKNIYALDGTKILAKTGDDIDLAVHEFGAGRAVYISGLPFSFENNRLLYRAILWSAGDEKNLHRWFSTNYHVEVHAYVANGKYCVVNNTYEPQETEVYTGDGSHFPLALKENEIRWFEI